MQLSAVAVTRFTLAKLGVHLLHSTLNEIEKSCAAKHMNKNSHHFDLSGVKLSIVSTNLLKNIKIKFIQG